MLLINEVNLASHIIYFLVSSALEGFVLTHFFLDVSAMPRGTPLYGQPSWWGDAEEDEQRAFKANGKPEGKSQEAGASGKNTSVAVASNSYWASIYSLNKSHSTL